MPDKLSYAELKKKKKKCVHQLAINDQNILTGN